MAQYVNKLKLQSGNLCSHLLRWVHPIEWRLQEIMQGFVVNLAIHVSSYPPSEFPMLKHHKIGSFKLQISPFIKKSKTLKFICVLGRIVKLVHVRPELKWVLSSKHPLRCLSTTVKDQFHDWRSILDRFWVLPNLGKNTSRTFNLGSLSLLLNLGFKVISCLFKFAGS